jgi:hypothetical protein
MLYKIKLINYVDEAFNYYPSFSITLNESSYKFIKELSDVLKINIDDCANQCLRLRKSNYFYWDEMINTALFNRNIVALCINKLDDKNLVEIPNLDLLERLEMIKLEDDSLVKLDITKNLQLQEIYFFGSYQNLKEVICTKAQSERFSEILKNIEKVNVVEGSYQQEKEYEILMKKYKYHSKTMSLCNGDEWDDFTPKDAMEIIADSDCDKGTAMYIYWYFLPNYYYTLYANEQEVLSDTLMGSLNIEYYKLTKEIERKISEDFYKTAIIRFDIKKDIYPNATEDNGPLKTKIPEYMYQSVKGTPWSKI